MKGSSGSVLGLPKFYATEGPHHKLLSADRALILKSDTAWNQSKFTFSISCLALNENMNLILKISKKKVAGTAFYGERESEL